MSSLTHSYDGAGTLDAAAKPTISTVQKSHKLNMALANS